jgi:2',3'-cyclic-nucleotide 2'-phosphodiesterase (5'-nucleotidase family)
LARRATAIKTERNTNKGLLLVLDAGRSLMGQWLAQKSEGKVTLEAMNSMGYDAMTLGQSDFILGMDLLKKREAEAKFPFLAANLVNTADNKPVFKAYVILERQGIRVGIIGLTETKGVPGQSLPDKTALLDPVETARRYVGELRSQVDLLIVLSHLGIEDDTALAKAVPGIDVIVGGNTSKLMEAPDRAGNTLIVQQGYRGEWMGRLQANFDAQGVPSQAKEEIITLDDHFADDAEVATLVKKWAVQFPSPTPPPTVVLPTPAPTAAGGARPPTPKPTVVVITPTASK